MTQHEDGPNALLLSAVAKSGMVNASMYERISQMLSNQYSLSNNGGIINFGVAENTLMHQELKDFLKANFELTDLDFSYGDSFFGSTRLFKALAKMFNRYFNPVIPVLPEHIITGAGLSAVIDQVCSLLCDRGDVILIARPYYDGFNADCTSRSGAELIGVDLSSYADLSSPSTLSAFEDTIQKLKSAGKRTRAVVLTTPHNPLGFCYPRETIIAYMRLAEKYNLHLLSDEIYGLSIFDNPHRTRGASPFVSVLAIDATKEAGCNPGRVHLLYGMSKDFCANGLRGACLVTQHNPGLREAFTPTALFMKMSSIADQLWSALLDNDAALDGFISTNRQRLTETYSLCRDFFIKHDIPFIEATAAFFIWIDLNPYLRDVDDNGKRLESPLDKDEDLWQSFLQAGIYIAPGFKYNATESGWFRFTFTVRPDYLKVGLERFERVLHARSRSSASNTGAIIRPLKSKGAKL